METNEALKQTLVQLADSSVETLLSRLQNVQEGDLHELEQQILTQMLEVGRGWLEQTVQQQGRRERAVARRKGSCGHSQRLVGIRSRQVVTLLGPLTLHRAYYQCLSGQETRNKLCCHGEAPFDEQWGLGRQLPTTFSYTRFSRPIKLYIIRPKASWRNFIKWRLGA